MSDRVTIDEKEKMPKGYLVVKGTIPRGKCHSLIEIASQEGIAGGVPAASDGMKAAAVMFATVPILIVYPWLQRYFIAGVTIGAVKG
ncbi:MAG: hypothetical protein LBF74_03435 [Treponema sp.]|jgi:hypothetical protein|nr:hypothetical protein [Treponema sp.]